MEPPVSEPRAPETMRAETAAALPPEEPPGMRSLSQGLRVCWKALFSVEEPMANSSMLVRPMKTAPSLRSLAIAVASPGGRYPWRIFEAQVAVLPATHILSLMAMGTPARARLSPASTRASVLCASSSACSAVTSRKARTLTSVSSILESASCVTSTAERRRAQDGWLRRLKICLLRRPEAPRRTRAGGEVNSLPALSARIRVPEYLHEAAWRRIRADAEAPPESPSTDRCKRECGRADASSREALRRAHATGRVPRRGARPPG